MRIAVHRIQMENALHECKPTWMQSSQQWFASRFKMSILRWATCRTLASNFLLLQIWVAITQVYHDTRNLFNNTTNLGKIVLHVERFDYALGTASGRATDFGSARVRTCPWKNRVGALNEPLYRNDYCYYHNGYDYDNDHDDDHYY